MSKRAILVATLALLLALAGCDVDATVTVSMESDGSGVVTVALRLDPEAVRAAESRGGTLEGRVRFADLAVAGWKIGPWVRAPDGAASIELSKSFTSPDQVGGIVAEISGPNGPIRDVQAVRDRGVVDTRYEVTGAVDLAAIQTGIAADPDLVAALTNQSVDVAAIDQSLLAQVRDSLSLRVVVELPDGTTTVHAVPGARVDIAAVSSVRDIRRILLLAVAVVLVVLALVVFFGGSNSRRRARARAPIPRFDPHGRRAP